MSFYIHLEEEILVLFWICGAGGGACRRGGAGCVLRQQWVRGPISVCNCSMLNLIDGIWDGVTIAFCIVAIARWMYSTLKSIETDAGASGSEFLPGCCFIWQEWQEGWIIFFSLGFLFFVCSDVARSSKAIYAKPCEFSSQEGDVFISVFL